MERSRAARRRQLANLYQAGNEDALLRRRRPRTSSQRRPRASGISRERETVRKAKEKALHGSIAETLQYGQRRAWHYGYQNEPGLSGSAPLAAASRYGARGTLKMVRREASASRGGISPDDDASIEGFQVDEWCPMLRSATSPSLATMTTPKAWPESALYPHGAATKRLQPSPWYDGETTANDVRAATAGSGMRRVAANHSQTMSVLSRNAALENTAKELALRPASPDFTGVRPATVGGVIGRGAAGKGKAKTAHVRTPKRIDQELGFLNGGITCFKAPKDSLRYGVGVDLKARLDRQTVEDGLKWSLLKQILKVITFSQQGLPLKAVAEVAVSFGEVVGTSVLATKEQFMDNITGRHVGFPESELTVLFGFFQTATTRPSAAATTTTARGTKSGSRCRVSPGCGDRGGGEMRGADWTAAVACLRLLARPKEPVLSAIVGVFEVFARALGSRLRHRQLLERERQRKEREAELVAARERWKRRRRREEQGLQAPGYEEEPRLMSTAHAVNGEDGQSGGIAGDVSRVSLAETARMFTLVSSNEEERHSLTTTYRHRFRLELQAVMHETRNPGRLNPARGEARAAPPSSPSRASTSLPRSNVHADVTRSQQNSPTESKKYTDASGRCTPALPDERYLTGEHHDEATMGGRHGGVGVIVEAVGEGGVTAEEFTEALMRCPAMIEAFGIQLASRLRYRHRPAWMAPILRAGGADGA